MIKTKKGNMVLTASLVITAILWLIFQFKLEEFPSFFFVQLDQITALLGTLLLSWSMLLMTRLNFLEKLFDGLDKVYKAHKWTSIWGMILITMHIISLAVIRIPNFDSAIKIFFPVHSQAYINWGAWSFWLFVFFVLITLFMKKIRMSYQIWKYIHKVTGIALIFAFIHIVLIPGNITASPILNIWLLLTTGTGIASWIYFEIFYKLLAPNYTYRVVKIDKNSDVFKIQLEAEDKKMAYKPGQFAYLSFIKSKISKEIHPFTITSHPDENNLAFAIRILGDYTQTLGDVGVGDIARVWGPYGNFADKFLQSDKNAIFIGGGIGIAPFISMLKEAKKKTKSVTKLDIFYCTKYKREACFDKDFDKETKNDISISYLNKCSREGSRLTISEIVKKVQDANNTIVYICGPNRMIKPIEKGLVSQGFPGANIVSESFDLL
jgi:predicted ferric reductase